MLTVEDGPFLLFRKLRDRMGFVHDSDGHIIGRPDGNVLSCLWCLSVWVALAMIVLPIGVSVVLAMSAMAIAFQRWISK